MLITDQSVVPPRVFALRALFSSDELRVLTDAAVSAASDLNDESRSRLRSSLTSTLGRIRTKSRKAILAETFTALLGRPVTAGMVETLDGLRGRYAHNPTEALTTPTPEAEQLLFDVVWALLKRDLRVVVSN